MTGARRRSPRRKLLLLAGILLGVGVLGCMGAWFFLGRHYVTLSAANTAFDSRVAQEFPEGSVWNLDSEDPGSGTALLLGLPAPPDAAESATTQDRLWRIYAEVYAAGGGGVGVARLGIGVAGGAVFDEDEGPENLGKVLGWEDNVIGVEDVAERTGLPQPPLHPLIDLMGGESFRIEPPGGEKR